VRLAPLILALFLASGCRNVTSPPHLGPSTSLAVYPDTDPGFTAFINELLDARARSTGVQRLMRSLVIPNSAAWFIETFGPTVGPVFDFRYRHQLGWQFARLYEYLPFFGRARNRQVFSDHSDGGHLSPMVRESQLISLADRPLKIYFAGVSNGEASIKIGYFVYVEGSFRLFGYFDIESKAEQLHSEYDKPFED
jgi:hypothetical protein